MKKIILIAPSTFAASDSAPIDKLLVNDFEIIKNPYGRKLTADELIKLLPGVYGMIAGLETLDRKVLKSSGLKVISRCGAGITNVDLEAAKELGIKVFSTPDAPTQAVAELTLGAMLSLIRNISGMNLDLHNKKWSKKIGLQLEGSTVAIIGFGRIGRRVAELLKAFKANLIAVDPYYKEAVDGVPVIPLDKALREADIITIHSSADKLILGEKDFSLMKDGVFLLNCSRGNAIDEEALARALDSGKVAGAWLDCFQEEPYTGPLIKYPQVILTPHAGSYTSSCRTRMEIEAVDNLIKGFREFKK